MKIDKESVTRLLLSTRASQTVRREVDKLLPEDFETAVAPAKEVLDIYSARARAEASTAKRGARFLGFGELLRRLAELPEQSKVAITFIPAQDYSLVLFSDTQFRHGYGLLKAYTPKAEFWNRYVKEREKLAYLRGTQDAIAQ